jgi:hypothetical protein
LNAAERIEAELHARPVLERAAVADMTDEELLKIAGTPA